MPHTNTAIIGAGPYGLSLSAHMTACGVPHEIFGEPMQAWRNFMPTGMLLRSEAFATSLYAPQPGYSIEDYFHLKNIDYQPVGMRMPLQTFIDYALWFQQQLVKHIHTVDVTNLQQSDGLFHLQLSDGSLWTAQRVVVALGLRSFEQAPPILQELPKPFAVHSAEIGDLSWAIGKDITIVGGGQSALGLAALMHEQGARVHVIVRDQAVTWNEKPSMSRSVISRLMRPEGGLGPGWRSHIFSEYPFIFYNLSYARRKRIIETSWGPSGAWWLQDRVTDKIDMHLGCRIASGVVEGTAVKLQITKKAATSTLVTDHVIIATGFKIDLRRHAFFSQDIIHSLSLIDGAPKLTRHFETNIRNLYIIGPASAYSFGPVMRFIYGAKYAAPHLAKYIDRISKPIRSTSTLRELT